MNGRQIDGKAMSEAGMCGGDAVGYYPPTGKGVVLVDWEDQDGDRGKWVLTARTPDRKLDVVMTVDTVDQVRRACDLVGCPLPPAVDQARMVSFATPSSVAKDTSEESQGVSGRKVSQDYAVTVKVLDVWKNRVAEREWKIVAGFILLFEPGKMSRSLKFRDSYEAERAAVKLLNDDIDSALKPKPRDESGCCGDGDETAGIWGADRLADEWLAGGDDAGEVREVSLNRVSTGQSSLTVTVTRDDSPDFHLKQVDRSYFAEDALPYLRSAIREMRDVYGLGHDLPLVPTADPTAG